MVNVKLSEIEWHALWLRIFRHSNLNEIVALKCGSLSSVDLTVVLDALRCALFWTFLIRVDLRGIGGCTLSLACTRLLLLQGRWLHVDTITFVLQLLHVLKMVHNSSTLNWLIKVFTAKALAVTGAKNSTLKALTVLFETGWLFTRTTLRVMLFSFRVTCSSGCLSIYSLSCIVCSCCISFVRRLWARLLGQLGIDLWSKRIWCLFKSWLDCALSYSFEERIVLARIAVASIWWAIDSRSEALTVQFEAARVPTVARLELSCCSWFSCCGLVFGCWRSYLLGLGGCSWGLWMQHRLDIVLWCSKLFVWMMPFRDVLELGMHFMNWKIAFLPHLSIVVILILIFASWEDLSISLIG